MPMPDSTPSATAVTLLIAGLPIRLSLGAGLTHAILPTSLHPFMRPGCNPPPAMTFELSDMAAEPDFAVFTTSIDDTTSDMGRITLWQTASGYLLRLIDYAGATHTLTANARFSMVRAAVDSQSPACSAAINSLLRIAFSQMATLHDAISIHASAIVADAGAILFLAPSGTGKSTHSHLIGFKRYSQFENAMTSHLSYEVRAYYLFGLGLRREVLEGLAG